MSLMLTTKKPLSMASRQTRNAQVNAARNNPNTNTNNNDEDNDSNNDDGQNVINNEISYPELGSEIINVNDIDYTRLITAVSSHLFNKNIITISELNFCSNREINNNMTLNDISNAGVRWVDYYLYLSLKSMNKDVNFIINESVEAIPVSIQYQSLGFLTFMGYTRAKFELNADEQIPKFLVQYFPNIINQKVDYNMITINPMKVFNLNWIAKVDINSFGQSFCNRIKSGAAGSRYFNVFKDYIFRNDIDPNILRVANIVKSIAEDGPFLEMHPSFSGTVLASMSITKNLMNLMTFTFTDETLKIIYDNKSSYVIPRRNNKFTQFLNWDDSFKNYYVMRIGDLGRINSNVSGTVSNANGNVNN